MSQPKSSPFQSDQPSPKVWIFQANPNKYRIHDALAAQSEDFWNLNQHVQEVSVGDRVLVWISGEEAGIYALGTVLTVPVLMADSAIGMPYWYVPTDGSQPKPRVRVRYDRTWLENPLSKEFLLTDTVLSGLQVLRQPRATNYRVTPGQWTAIQQWLDLDEP